MALMDASRFGQVTEDFISWIPSFVSVLVISNGTNLSTVFKDTFPFYKSFTTLTLPLLSGRSDKILPIGQVDRGVSVSMITLSPTDSLGNEVFTPDP